MANDRIWLVCKGCGATKLLYKYYPTGGFACPDKEALGDWINAHLIKCRHEGEDVGHLGGNPGFTLETEQTVDWERMRRDGELGLLTYVDGHKGVGTDEG